MVYNIFNLEHDWRDISGDSEFEHGVRLILNELSQSPRLAKVLQACESRCDETIRDLLQR